MTETRFKLLGSRPQEPERVAQRGARRWLAAENQIVLERLLGRIEQRLPECPGEELEAVGQALAEFVTLDREQRDAWIESRPWGSEALALAERLLDEEAERIPLDRLELARLAARLVVRAPILADDRLTHARVEEVFGRAGLLEVRALRRQGRLEEARGLLAELTERFVQDPSILSYWLTLRGENALTRGLLACDAGQLTLARSAFHRASRMFRLAGTEEEDFELFTGQVRLDLRRSHPNRALERWNPRPAFKYRDRRVALAFLEVSVALRTRAPLLARRAVLGLLGELGPLREANELARFQVAEAAVRLAEGHPVTALQAVAPAQERFRAEGVLLGSLRAGVVSTRALRALHRHSVARKALAASVLERFHDMPDLPSVRAVLEAVAAAGYRADLPAFLDRLELWLTLAEDSPGVELPE